MRLHNSQLSSDMATMPGLSLQARRLRATHLRCLLMVMWLLMLAGAGSDLHADSGERGEQPAITEVFSRPISVVVDPVTSAPLRQAVARRVNVVVVQPYDPADTDALARAVNVLVQEPFSPDETDAIARAVGVLVQEPIDTSQSDAVARAISVAIADMDIPLDDAIARAHELQVTAATNDYFTSATLIAGEAGSIAGTIRGTTYEPLEPSHRNSAPWSSIWYKWEAPIGGAYSFDACGGEYAARVAVYSGDTLDTLQSVASLGDTGLCDPRGELRFRALVGDEYYIALDGYNRNWGETMLQWSRIPPPGNDNYENATIIAGDAGLELADNTAATNQDDEPAHLGETAFASLWWRWIAPEDGTFEFRTCGSSFDTRLAVYIGSSLDTLTEVASSDDCCGLQSIVEIDALLGEQYYIAIDSSSGLLGEVMLEWREIEAPANDSVAAAEILSGSEGALVGSLFGAGLEAGEPDHAVGADGGSVWYRWSAPRNGDYRFIGSGDPQISLFSGTGIGDLTLLDRRPDQVNFTATEGQSYLVAMTGTSCSADDFELIWSYLTPPLISIGLGTLDVAAIDSTGTFFATGGGGGAFLRSLATGEVVRRFEGHTDSVTALDFSADTTLLATASLDETARLWDIQLGGEYRRFRHPAAVTSVAISPDGERLLTGCIDGNARVWSIENATEIFTLPGHVGGVTAVDFAEDGMLALSASGEGSIRVWLADNGAHSTIIEEHDEPVLSAIFSKDGGSVLSASVTEGGVLSSASSGVSIRRFGTFLGDTTSAAFSDDQSLVLVARNDGPFTTPYGVDIYERTTGDRLATYGEHSDIIRWVGAIPGSDSALTASSDRSVHTWEIDDRQTDAVFGEYTDRIVGVSLSSDLSYLYTRDENNLQTTWDILRGVDLQTSPPQGVSFTPTAAAIDTSVYAVAGGEGPSRIFELRPARAIIVAGGGAYAGNAIARQTHDLGLYAWRTLRARGYSPEDILYLSAFTDGHDFGDGGDPVAWDIDDDGTDEVDAYASADALREALSDSFAQDAGRLLMLMVDHGYKTADVMAFRINPDEAVTSADLNDQLDALQNATPVEVTLLVDSCYSGRFVVDCAKTSAIPAERGRIVISSSSDSAEAVFLPAPDLTSFVYTFLSSAYMGNSFGESYRSGARFFQTFPVANQVPWIHDGETFASSPDAIVERANRQFFGATWAYGVQSDQNINDFFPVFDSVEPAIDAVIAPGTPILLRAQLLPYQRPERVVVVMRPPAPQVISGEPVTGLPRVELSRVSADVVAGETWEATIPAELVSALGPYRATFTAEFPNQRLSDPQVTAFTVSDDPGAGNVEVRAVLAFGESSFPATASALSQASDFAWAIYLDRLQDSDGVPHPEWIDFFSPHPLRYSARTTRPHEIRAMTAYQEKFARGEMIGAVDTTALLDAITTRGEEAERLYLHLVVADASDSMLRFGDGIEFSASALDSVLDDIQSLAHEPEVVVIVDGAGSGSFLMPLAATGTQRRVIVTSSQFDQCAVFLSDPVVTFTHKLLGPLWGGENFHRAVLSVDGFYAGFLGEFVGTRIRPQLDDNGDGVSDFLDGILAAEIYLGNRFVFAGDEASGLPFVLEAEVIPPSAPGEPALLRARLLSGVTPVIDTELPGPEQFRVYAQFTPPGLVCGENAQEFPVFRLRRQPPDPDQGESWIWTRQITPGFLPAGEHPVTFYAEYPDGPDNTRLSAPRFGTLEVDTQLTGSLPDVYEADSFNDDTAAGTRNVLVASDGAQDHTIHQYGDDDWFLLVLSGRGADSTPAAIPHGLVFEDTTVPSGTALQVEVFHDEPPLLSGLGVDCGSSNADDCFTVTGPIQRNVLTDGVTTTQVFWVRVSLVGTGADESTPVRYSVSVQRNTGARNVVVSTIGTTPTIATRPSGDASVERGGESPSLRGLVWFGINQTTPSGTTIDNLDSLRVYRYTFDWTTQQVGNEMLIADLPQPVGECVNCTALDGAETCAVIVDGTLPPPSTMPGGSAVFYEIRSVRDGVEESWTSPTPSYGRVDPQLVIELPECLDGVLVENSVWLFR